jgi:hypothetical protein
MDSLNELITSIRQIIAEHHVKVQKLSACMLEVKEYESSSMMSRMMNAITFGCYESRYNDYCAKPELPWEDRFESKEYPGMISVDPADLSAPIMRGKTPDGRHFIAIKLKIGDQVATEVLFPYSLDDEETWIGSSYYGSHRPVEETLFFASGQPGLGLVERHQHAPAIKVNQVVLDRLNRLLQGGTVAIEEPCWDSFEVRKGPTIALAAHTARG